MVVIAIIGVLSGVIIISLSGAQNSAKDTRIKMGMDQLRSAAKIQNVVAGSYLNFYTLSNDVDLILDDIADQGGNAESGISVNVDGSSFCVTSVLNSNNDLWCVDSTGYVGVGGCLNYSCNYDSGVGAGGGSGGGTPWACGDSITDARDGTTNTYATVLIGDQCWTAENLKCLPSVVGPGTGATDTVYYYVYNYDGISTDDARSSVNYSVSGVLYNWTAATTACPTGWHLPTHDEWTTLERAVCTSGTCATDFPYDTTTTGWRGTDEGTTLKTEDFNVLISGYRYITGVFSSGVAFWSSTDSSVSSSWERYLLGSSSMIYRNTPSNGCGFSVRCIRN